ncbi:sodium/potassium/calcium exchanger 4-like [Mya arenaria]|uniref:sodium/potassium/calcium exchanger 4-like n=1 Tax=Mya arenaria TaxID=6604 RepID=UPI0022E3B3C2|nr:sodium/potassium/calcium exchanger 4-like [Mya arenaria]
MDNTYVSMDPKGGLRTMYRRKGQVRKYMFMIMTTGYLALICLSFVLKSEYLEKLHGKTSRAGAGIHEESAGNGRYKRQADFTTQESLGAVGVEEKNCTSRAIEEFPKNWFTLKETQDGAIALHIAIALYMFGALAIVCDDYFVPSLEFICERLNLQEDVAGATFMAAGSSAPEFFTSVIGVFIAKSDVGVGTIVGSAVFNILFIIGVCAIFAGMVVKLTWYPMTRDCLFYLISIAALVIVIDDEQVYWYEGLVLVILYMIYILIMYFNRYLEDKAIHYMKPVIRYFRSKACKDVEADEKQPLSENSLGSNYTSDKASTSSADLKPQQTGFSAASTSSEEPIVHHPEEEKPYKSPFIVPDGAALRMYWVIMMPLKCIFFVSIPDCRREGAWHKFYIMTFIMSIVWIAACSYLMVWMVTIIGDALDIPDTVMGLTILAAGTSVPDCLSSIFVARDGYGDMAVSNSIGSNVFDILMCLGLPWLLDTAIVKKGDPLIINSGGISYSALILLFTVAFMLVCVNLAKWKLTKPFGALCLVVYVIVISISCLFELNVFGDFVAKSCPRSES